MLTRVLLTFLVLLALSACATTKAPPVVAPEAPQTREACEAQGLTWGCRGVPGEGCPEICRLLATDAGRQCTHSDQCQGECIGQKSGAKTGRCSDQVVVAGCNYILNDFGTKHQMCID